MRCNKRKKAVKQPLILSNGTVNTMVVFQLLLLVATSKVQKQLVAWDIGSIAERR
jgi:hypothetical protein